MAVEATTWPDQRKLLRKLTLGFGVAGALVAVVAEAATSTIGRTWEIAETDALSEIARVPRWLCRPAVQRSLILNPYSPVRLTVTLLPLLSPNELVEVSRDRSLHRLTCAAARVLLELRGWEKPTFH